jgi:hypothetical protein
MFVRSAVLAAVLGLIATPAFAMMNAPDAQMHFKAVASGDVSGIMSQYAPHATLLWIGGPLDGSYTGSTAIQTVWDKFSHAAGKMTEKVSDIVVGTNSKGMTVTANVKFIGKKTIPVRYVLAYRNGKIVDEIWQIAPNIAMH